MSGPLTFPAAWEDALRAAAAEQLPTELLSPRALAPAIAERTRRYTSERGRLHDPVAPRDRARDLAARALFFTIADAPRISVPLAELSWAGRLPDREPLRVLDLGAGVGAMTLGLAAALPGRRIEATLVDRDRSALELCARAAELGPGPLTVRRAVADVGAPLPAGPFDLVLAGTVLNELPQATRAGFVERALAALAPGGVLILVEPALRETARALHELRDAVLARGLAYVFAPCTRLGPCPALDDESSWCHEDRPFAPPPRLADLIRQTGLRREGAKFAYLTLTREPGTFVKAPPGTSALRVVSGPLDAKGVVERITCGEAGRGRLRVLRREGAERTRALAESRRGDVLLRTPEGQLERVRVD